MARRVRDPPQVLADGVAKLFCVGIAAHGERCEFVELRSRRFEQRNPVAGDAHQHDGVARRRSTTSTSLVPGASMNRLVASITSSGSRAKDAQVDSMRRRIAPRVTAEDPNQAVSGGRRDGAGRVANRVEGNLGDIGAPLLHARKLLAHSSTRHRALSRTRRRSSARQLWTTTASPSFRPRTLMSERPSGVTS